MRRHHATVVAVLATLALACGVNATLAQTTATGTGNANSSSSSGAVAIGGSAGAQATGGSVVFNTPGSTSARVRQTGSLRTTPNAIAPGLGSAAIETCYGPGVSAGLAVTGFGASFGAGQYDNECNLRLWARTLFAMGQRELVGAVLTQSPTIMRAMQTVDSQRGGQVVYGRRTTVAYGGQGTASRGARFAGCRKWSGGAVGVGSCVVPD